MDQHSIAGRRILDQVLRVTNITPPNISTINRNQHDRSDNPVMSNNMKRRLEAERAAIRHRLRDDQSRQQNAIKRQKEFNEKTKAWNEQILPFWEDFAFSNRVKELCAKGIPPNIRGKVWPLLIGNDLQVV